MYEHINIWPLVLWQTLNRLFIVNAGSGFRALWKVLKAFLDARTINKIEVSKTVTVTFPNRTVCVFNLKFKDYNSRFLEATIEETWLNSLILGTASIVYTCPCLDVCVYLFVCQNYQSSFCAAAICQLFCLETAHVLTMGVAWLVIKDPGMIPKSQTCFR